MHKQKQIRCSVPPAEGGGSAPLQKFESRCLGERRQHLLGVGLCGGAAQTGWLLRARLGRSAATVAGWSVVVAGERLAWRLQPRQVFSHHVGRVRREGLRDGVDAI